MNIRNYGTNIIALSFSVSSQSASFFKEDFLVFDLTNGFKVSNGGIDNKCLLTGKLIERK